MQNKANPDQWFEIDLLLIPKSGNLSDEVNYRKIALSNISLKIINGIILNRIQKVVDSHVRRNKNGFRPGRAKTSQILALKSIIGVKSRLLPAIITFVDFSNIFDNKVYGIPEELALAIGKSYKETKTCMLSSEGWNSCTVCVGISQILSGFSLLPCIVKQ